MKAIYYPYSICTDKNALKVMLLLFEQVLFLDSKPDEISKLSHETLLGVDNDLLSAYSYAQKKGVISIYNPKDILNEYDLLISKSVFDDVCDDDFIYASSAFEVASCSITNDRLPQSYNRFFRPAGFTYSESLELQRIIGEKIKSGIDTDCEIESWRFPKITLENALDYYKNQGFYDAMSGSFSISPPIDTFRHIPLMHFLSLRINEAILAANKMNACIVTDNSIVQRLYEIRLNRIVNSSYDKISDFKNYKFKFNDIQARVAYALFDEIIASSEFAKLSIQDVIDFRVKNQKRLLQLWKQIDIISSEIGFEQGDQQGYDIYVTVHKRLQEIDEERKALVDDFRQSIKKATIQSFGIVVPVISANLALGANLETVFVSSAVAELGYLTTSGVEHILEASKKIKLSKGSSFSYLVECNSAKPLNLVRKQLIKHFESQIVIKGIAGDTITLILICDKNGQYICYTMQTIFLETSVFVNKNMSMYSFERILKKYTLVDPVISDSSQAAIIEACKNYAKVKKSSLQSIMEQDEQQAEIVNEANK
ncbi:MAG: hypothetical protein K2H37_13085 [Lachnospiraceae bacterium]|nr:hypothetical protein [Lachnospiraceae bacterium]